MIRSPDNKRFFRITQGAAAALTAAVGIQCGFLSPEPQSPPPALVRPASSPTHLSVPTASPTSQERPSVSAEVTKFEVINMLFSPYVDLDVTDKNKDLVQSQAARKLRLTLNLMRESPFLKSTNDILTRYRNEGRLSIAMYEDLQKELNEKNPLYAATVALEKGNDVHIHIGFDLRFLISAPSEDVALVLVHEGLLAEEFYDVLFKQLDSSMEPHEKLQQFSDRRADPQITFDEKVRAFVRETDGYVYLRSGGYRPSSPLSLFLEELSVLLAKGRKTNDFTDFRNRIIESLS